MSIQDRNHLFLDNLDIIAVSLVSCWGDVIGDSTHVYFFILLLLSTFTSSSTVLARRSLHLEVVLELFPGAGVAVRCSQNTSLALC